MRKLAFPLLAALVVLMAGCAGVDSYASAAPPRPQTTTLPPKAAAPTTAPIKSATPTSASTKSSTPTIAPTATVVFSSTLGTVERDITYCTNEGVALKMDIHYPLAMTKPAPIVVYVHGGSWSSGDKSDPMGATDMPELLARGYLVASVDYRHAPQWKFPAQIHDVKCAIRFLRANAARFNLDSNRIGAWGHSAGGHLAALLGLTDKLDGFDAAGEYADQSSRVQAVADLSGRADLRGMSADKAASVFGVESDSAGVLSHGSPITFVSKDDAPFLIFHGDKDDVVPLQVSTKLDELLKKAGVPVTLVVVKNGDHMFRPSGGPMSPTRAEMTKMMADFFEKYLRRP